MPRRRTPEQPPPIPSTALVASATRYSGGKASRIYQQRKDWQAECYRHYSICGEARFAAKFFGHAVSRATLHAARLERGKVQRQDQGPEFDALGALFNGEQGQSQMLESIGIHLTIAGECYLVGRSVDNVDVWQVVSVLEMEVTGNRWQVNYFDGNPPVELKDDDVVIRIWLPNPERQIEPESPFRSLLPILSEIEWLTRHVFAQVSSRLAGAGILMVPQGMSFPPPTDEKGEAREVNSEADALMYSLADAMMAPLEDPGSPAALVPLVITAPDDAIDKMKLLHFWSDLDENSMSLREEAIRRFALGMDLPPEQVLGMSSNSGTGGGNSNGVSHWGAWQIEEATIKMHVEPMLEVIVNALTIGYLRPLMEDSSVVSLVVYDTSSLRLRPDRSKEAFELYDRGLLKADVLLRENGFEATDLPDDEEWKRWMLVKIASGSATPEQVQAALGSLGVELGITTEPSAPPAPELPPTPSLEDHPRNPRTPNESALIAAADALVYRALERAGNRLRQQGGHKPVGVPSYETHMHIRAENVDHVLQDAWACAPQVLEGISEHAKVIPVLNDYCRTLLTEQAPHKRERMADMLRLAV